MLDRITKYKALAIVMSILMFTTSMGFSIDMHYCQGAFKNLSLLGDAKSCHDRIQNVKKQASCHKVDDQQQSISRNGCCDNKTISVQLEDDFLKTEMTSFSSNQFTFLLAFAITSLNINSAPVIDSPYQNYKPPLLDKDIPILIQTFRC